MKHLLLIFFSFYITVGIHGQSKSICGDQLLRLQLEEKYPGVSNMIEETFKKAKTSTSARVDVLRIPVVFHVIYNTDEQNISDESIKDQIDVLNEDFRRLNLNAVETRTFFEDRAADAEIEFFLAGQDPNGNPTNGITRTFTEKETFIDISFEQILAAIQECGFDLEDPDVFACIEEFLGDFDGFDLDLMKSSETGGVDAWNTKSYLNIWCVNLAVNTAGMETPFILGFAYPPMEAPNWPDGTLPDDLISKDGVALHYSTVGGRNNPNAGVLTGINDQGRTCVHEIGHYLGLRHIWGDGDCSADDGITDTPIADSESQAIVDFNACSELHDKDSCVDDMEPDMIENYMDYSPEKCQNMFTQEQVDLMRSMLEGPRSGLLLNQISAVDNIPSSKVIVYPNPSEGEIRIIGWQNSMVAKIYNRSGQLILQSSDSTIHLELVPGLYFIEIIEDNDHQIHKLLIN